MLESKMLCKYNHHIYFKYYHFQLKVLIKYLEYLRRYNIKSIKIHFSPIILLNSINIQHMSYLFIFLHIKKLHRYLINKHKVLIQYLFLPFHPEQVLTFILLFWIFL